MKGFHHVALKATDFDKTVAFYTKGLGFKQSLAWGEGDGSAAMIDIGNGNTIEIFAGGTAIESEGAPILHFAFCSDCCDDDLAKAVKAGAIVTLQPSDVDIPSSPVKPVRIAFCKGLCGELIEFFQER